MKVTRYILIVALIALSSCDKDDDRAYSNENGRFVRFFLQLDRDQDPIVAPAIDLSRTAVESYTKDNVKQLKIPVTLISEPLSETVTVSYEAAISGLNNVLIEPQNQLTFSGSQLIDTLYVTPLEIWDPASNPSITLTLTDTSDPSIQLGLPNDVAPNNTLTINFGTVDLKYNISSATTNTLIGNQGEQFEIVVDFPNGFIEEDLEGIDLFTVTQSNFDYLLESQEIMEDDQVKFTFTVNQDFNDPAQFYKTSLTINPIDGYEQTGVPTIKFERPIVVPRDKTVNTASNFYNASDPFYRTFGTHWFNDGADNVCNWESFNAFTNPVIVSADDPNAVLADDRGTSDPNDDLYYHAFRISFNSNLDNRTTNPFNLKRWFTNEGSNEDTSPGFNIIPALEFFPTNGNSATQGTVQVLEQTLQIGTTTANGGITEFFNISGAGTYQEIAPGLIEIILDVSLTNNRLFGGTRTDSYRIYNSSNFTDPADLTIDCKTPIAL